ncbi:MAG: site-2 protease family protein, partial [Armatimonadetes bacterium]|nr:site-2 protease family protein [Armatimonadota bacterium]
MPWSVQIARSFGIPIRLHVTFLLLLGWIVFAGVSRGDFTQAVVAAGIFACVIAHELGHALMARRFGVEVVDITLFPIGGVARMASIPKIPQHEFWIAIAGPL